MWEALPRCFRVSVAEDSYSSDAVKWLQVATVIFS
jgi:hypothetical protein